MADEYDSGYDSSYEFDYLDETGSDEDDWMSIDSDGDGLTDYEETSVGFEMLVRYFWPDESGSEYYEGDLGYWEEHLTTVYTDEQKSDSDGDLISDFDEIYVFTGFNPMDESDGNRDDDNDFLTVGEEWQIGTSWNNPDHDGGGELDGIEVLLAGTDPRDPLDDSAPAENNASGTEDPGGIDTNNQTSVTNVNQSQTGATDQPSGNSSPSSSTSSASVSIPFPKRFEDSNFNVFTVTQTRSLSGGEPPIEEEPSQDEGEEERVARSEQEKADLEAEGFFEDAERQEEVQGNNDDGGAPEMRTVWDMIRYVYAEVYGSTSEGTNYIWIKGDNQTPDTLVEGSDITEDSTYSGNPTQKLNIPEGQYASKSIGGGGSASVGEDNYPDAQHQKLWVELSRKIETDFERSFVVREIDEDDDREYGVVTFKIPKGRTTSSSVTVKGNFDYLEVDGGKVTLNPPVRNDQSGDSRSINLYPIQFLNKAGKEVPFLKIATMKDSLDATDQLNVEDDPDSFYLKIPNSSQLKITQVKLATIKNKPARYNDSETTLMTRDVHSNTETARLLLVSDTVDDDHDQSDNQIDDQTHLAHLDGKVQIKGITIHGDSIDFDHQFCVEPIQEVELNVVVFKNSGTTAAAVTTHIETVVNERFAQVGVKFKPNVVERDWKPAYFKVSEHDLNTGSQFYIRRWNGELFIPFGPRLMMDEYGAAESTKDIHAFVTPNLMRHDDGGGPGKDIYGVGLHASTAWNYLASQYRNNVFVRGDSLWAFSHELGHLITDKVHYGTQYEDGADPHLIEHNLMKDDLKNINTIGGPKRLFGRENQ